MPSYRLFCERNASKASRAHDAVGAAAGAPEDRGVDMVVNPIAVEHLGKREMPHEFDRADWAAQK